MLHARRKRLAALAAREADGDSFWSEVFEKQLRVRLLYVFDPIDQGGHVRSQARTLILQEEGLFFLSNPRWSASDDFNNFVLECPDEMMPTAIEAFSQALVDQNIQILSGSWYAGPKFEELVNTLLREHRVSYELSAGEMVPFSSRELHEAVVAPALRLLAAGDGWGSVEMAYRKALEEISKGDAADAVTDAGTALQEALTVLGCQGNALGPLIRSARSRGLFAGHDVGMLDAIEKTMSWVSADRSNTGDAHNAQEAKIEDAWLIVHIVGALVLRLSKVSGRGAAAGGALDLK